MGDRLLPQGSNQTLDAAKVVFHGNNHTDLNHFLLVKEIFLLKSNQHGEQGCRL
jgi:hypothetical protein